MNRQKLFITLLFIFITNFKANVFAQKNGYKTSDKLLELKWKFKTKGIVYSSPSVYNGTVYFGSDDNYFYAVNAETGQLKWKIRTKGAIRTNPAVYKGLVFFASVDSYMYAVESETGRIKWKYKTWNSIYSSPAVLNGTVFFGSDDGYFYAVNAKTGQLNWKFKTGKFIYSSPVISNGKVFFEGGDCYLYALNSKNGHLKWKFQTYDSHYDCVSSPAVANGKVFVGNWDSDFFALDADTGQEKWRYVTGNTVQARPYIINNTVLFGSRDGYFYAVVSDTGQPKWSFYTGGPVVSSPIVFKGLSFFGTNAHALYIVDVNSGKKKWKFRAEDAVESSPVISNGIVFFGSNDYYLYALKINLHKEGISLKDKQKETYVKINDNLNERISSKFTKKNKMDKFTFNYYVLSALDLIYQSNEKYLEEYLKFYKKIQPTSEFERKRLMEKVKGEIQNKVSSFNYSEKYQFDNNDSYLKEYDFNKNAFPFSPPKRLFELGYYTILDNFNRIGKGYGSITMGYFNLYAVNYKDFYHIYLQPQEAESLLNKLKHRKIYTTVEYSLLKLPIVERGKVVGMLGYIERIYLFADYKRTKLLLTLTPKEKKDFYNQYRYAIITNSGFTSSPEYKFY